MTLLNNSLLTVLMTMRAQTGQDMELKDAVALGLKHTWATYMNKRMANMFWNLPIHTPLMMETAKIPMMVSTPVVL